MSVQLPADFQTKPIILSCLNSFADLSRMTWRFKNCSQEQPLTAPMLANNLIVIMNWSTYIANFITRNFILRFLAFTRKCLSILFSLSWNSSLFGIKWHFVKGAHQRVYLIENKKSVQRRKSHNYGEKWICGGIWPKKTKIEGILILNNQCMSFKWVCENLDGHGRDS